MNNLLTLGLLSLPLLLRKVKTHRRGLMTGLFCSLYLWGILNPLLSAVSFGAALWIFIDCRKLPEQKSPPFYVKNPGTVMLSIFVSFMAVFCALGDSFYDYGFYIGIREKVLDTSSLVSYAGYLLGPLWIGGRCDRKGPFGTAVFLTLLSECAVLFASVGSFNLLLFIAGSFLEGFCIAGFFTLLPLLIAAFYGESFFLRFYLSAAGSVFIFRGFAAYQYAKGQFSSANPGEFLIGLLFLTLLSVFALYMAWKKRFVLVRVPKPSEKVSG